MRWSLHVTRSWRNSWPGVRRWSPSGILTWRSSGQPVLDGGAEFHDDLRCGVRPLLVLPQSGQMLEEFLDFRHVMHAPPTQSDDDCARDDAIERREPVTIVVA